MKKAAESLESEVSELTRLSRDDLIGKFQKVYGKAPPLRLSTSTLAAAVAYRLQERASEGLSPSLRRHLLAGVDNIRRPASPGTLLIREYRGVEHQVLVHADHIEYAGTKYRSLTEVARLISGQKRSGPEFFGLRSRANG